MQTRNLKYNENGSIDMEIEHDAYGWIPFTASPDDSAALGRELHAAALAGNLGSIITFVKPLGKAVEEQLKLIENAYLVASTLPILSSGSNFQTDDYSTTLMNKVLSTLTAAGGTSGVTWWNVDNVGVNLTYAEFSDLCLSILLRNQSLFATKQAKKSLIRAATTVAQVEAITL